MPTYCYKCLICDVVFEEFHSISEIRADCSSCGTIGSLDRQPSAFIKIDNTNKSGQIMKDFIEEAREDLYAQKKEAKK